MQLEGQRLLGGVTPAVWHWRREREMAVKEGYAISMAYGRYNDTAMKEGHL